MTKKVLIFRNKLLPYSETFIKAQAEALKSWDYMYLTGNLLNELPLDHSRVLLLPDRAKNKFSKKLFGWFYRWQHQKFVALIKTLGFDLVHAHFGTDAIKIADWVEKLNIPLVITLHGFDINIHRHVWESGAKGRRRKDYPQKLLALAARQNVHFVAVSEAIRAQAIIFGVPADKITVQYIGIDTDKFKPRNHASRNYGGLTSKNILFVGRMVEKKGAKILIQAFAKVREKIPDAQLIMIGGDGGDLSCHQQLAAQLQVPVEFLGVRSAREVADYLNRARVFCLPSITTQSGDAEGLGLVILEAQASGVPVVTSARGGATEGIVDGETGFGFAEGDVEALAAHLICLLNDDALAVRFSRAAVVHCREKFDLKKCTKALEAYYDRLSD